MIRPTGLSTWATMITSFDGSILDLASRTSNASVVSGHEGDVLLGEGGHEAHSPLSRAASRAGSLDFTSAFISVSTRSERLVPLSSASTFTLRCSDSLTITVIGFLSGAVVVEGVGFGAAADCSEVSSGLVPLLLVLVGVDLFGVVVLVMAGIRPTRTMINRDARS